MSEIITLEEARKLVVTTELPGDSILKNLPKDEGLLPEPVDMGDGIFVYREFDPVNLYVALFDFDGTLSDERRGWPNLMVQNNLAWLVSLSNPHLPVDVALPIVIDDIATTIGIPTYMQMKRCLHIAKIFGYEGDVDPSILKKTYGPTLDAMVEQKRTDFTEEELRIPGSLELLNTLQKRLEGGLYLATGTDVDKIRESVDRLGFGNYFPIERIVGAGSLGPEDCAKQHVINEKLLGERGLSGNQIVTFGDGFPEILYTHLAGGIGIGYVTSDHSDYEHMQNFTMDQKRDRLIAAGANVIVMEPTKKKVDRVVEVVFNGYQQRAA